MGLNEARMSKTVRPWLVLTMLVWVAYPLAYAPLIRLQCGSDRTYIRISWVHHESRWGKVGTVQYPAAPRWTGVFLPIRFLSTRTPFSYPLRIWAELWEVDSQQDEYNAD